MIYGIFNLKKKKFTFCRAGHCPLLYWDQKQKDIYLIEPPGLAVGLEAGPIFKKILTEETISLNSGDVFIFFTDGVTEARNHNQKEFEEQRLCDVIVENHDHNSNDIKNKIIVTIITTFFLNIWHHQKWKIHVI